MGYAKEQSLICILQLLLLLWKSILACLGGNKDLKRAKKLVRDIEGLPKDLDSEGGGE